MHAAEKAYSSVTFGSFIHTTRATIKIGIPSDLPGQVGERWISSWDGDDQRTPSVVCFLFFFFFAIQFFFVPYYMAKNVARC